MADILEMVVQREPDADSNMTNIEKMQLAVQITALVRASFTKPTDSDLHELLQMTATQLSLPSSLHG
jgi:hypothetical protein